MSKKKEAAVKKIIYAVISAVMFGTCLVFAAQDTAADFTLPGLDGKPVKLADSLGRGYVVVNFWARWCASCEEEVPELAALKKQPGADTAVFIGVNAGDSQSKAAKFVAKFKYPYLVALDKDKAVTKKYGILGLPVTLIIAKDGKIVFRGSRPPKKFDFTK